MLGHAIMLFVMCSILSHSTPSCCVVMLVSPIPCRAMLDHAVMLWCDEYHAVPFHAMPCWAMPSRCGVMSIMLSHAMPCHVDGLVIIT